MGKIRKIGYCQHSGTIEDDIYRDYNYRDGIPILECPTCGVRRKLQKVTRSVGPRGAGMCEDMLIFPYHKSRKQW